MRRSLQITMLVVAAIPLALGLTTFVVGGGQFVPADQVTATLDSQIRFYAVWFTAVFFLTVWCVRNLERAGPVMRIMFGTMALGGAARLYSMSVLGLPEPTMIVAAGIEIGVLLFLPWHAAVLRDRAGEAPSGA